MLVDLYKGKRKAIPLQAWRGPECSRKLRFTDFMTTQDLCKFVSPTHRPPLPREMLFVLISVRGWVDSSIRHIELTKLYGMNSIKTIISCATVCLSRKESKQCSRVRLEHGTVVGYFMSLVEGKRQNIVNVCVKFYVIVWVALSYSGNGVGGVIIQWVNWGEVYRGADESLVRPGRKQVNVSVRMAWISFGALPCRKKKLMTARVSMLLKSRTSPDMLLSLCPFWSG